jgi:hypothetical protein
MEELGLTETRKITPLERPPELLQCLLTIVAFMAMVLLMIAIAQPHGYCYADDFAIPDQSAK